MTAAHYKGGHHPGNDLGLHYTALPPIVASCPYSDQLLVTPKFCSPGANRPSQASHERPPRQPRQTAHSMTAGAAAAEARAEADQEPGDHDEWPRERNRDV